MPNDLIFFINDNNILKIILSGKGIGSYMGNNLENRDHFQILVQVGKKMAYIMTLEFTKV